MESVSTDPWLFVRSFFPMEVGKKKKKILQEVGKIWI